jgi:uncharacterized membrane protein
MPVYYLKQIMPYFEFKCWIHYYRTLDEKITKNDKYLANINAEIRRSWVKNPKTVKSKNFIIETKYEKIASTDERIARSKQAWGSYLAPNAYKNKKA